jgi:hypothetical protein
MKPFKKGFVIKCAEYGLSKADAKVLFEKTAWGWEDLIRHLVPPPKNLPPRTPEQELYDSSHYWGTGTKVPNDFRPSLQNEQRQKQEQANPFEIVYETPTKGIGRTPAPVFRRKQNWQPPSQPMQTQPMQTQPMQAQPMQAQPMQAQPMPMPPVKQTGQSFGDKIYGGINQGINSVKNWMGLGTGASKNPYTPGTWKPGSK